MARGDEEDYVMSREFDEDQADHEFSEMKARLRSRAGKNMSRALAGREPVTSVAKVESDRSRKNSRVKGTRAELEVAELFARWSGEVVRRTPGSGGWSNARFGVRGDLVCPNKAFPFHVEVKFREGWMLDDLVTGVRREHDKSIVQWWKQCVESCPKRKRGNGYIEYGKEPLLVFRRSRQPWLVMFRRAANSPAGQHEWLAAIKVPYETEPDVVVMLLEQFLVAEPVPKGLKNHVRMP